MPKLPQFQKKSKQGINFRRGYKKQVDAESSSTIEDAISTTAMNPTSLSIASTSHAEMDLNRSVTPTQTIVWPIVETPPPLNIERVRLVGQEDRNVAKITGRRIADMAPFITAVRKLENHECHVSKTGYLAYHSESQDGFNSLFKFKCSSCNETRTIHTNPYTEECDTNVNFCATWGVISNGKGHACLNEVMAMMQIPTMAGKTFLKYQQVVGDVWLDSLTNSMTEAAEEEYQNALASGSMTGDIGRCTVIVDGGWSHRSYGHGYKSNSGVACIIGKYTKKLLFLGIRNKYCSICALAYNKGQEPKQHKCYRNWSGSSPAMEADIIVEGFLCSEENYKLQYTTFIGDGDSSVYNKLQQHVTYSKRIEKVDCANHLTKNLTKHLHRFAAESARNKRLMTATRINHIGKSCRKLITLHSKRRGSTPELLRDDIKNVIYHVFGNHLKCKSYSCDKYNTTELNELELCTGEMKARLINIIDNLASKARSLFEDSTSNLAEMYMHIVSKFTGGKQSFYGRRNSFNIRCYGAGLSFQYGPAWIAKVWRNKFLKSPGKQVKRLIKVREQLNRIPRVRKHLFSNMPAVTDNPHYGTRCEQPDMPADQISQKVKEQIENLGTSIEQQKEIEFGTIGQTENARWFTERDLRLTASHFGEICKRRKNPGNLVYNIIHRKVPNIAQINYGRMNESVASAAYSRLTGNTVTSCGLFVCTEINLGFLAGSPDGTVGDDRIIEVKCPWSAKEYTPLEACERIKNFYCKVVDGAMKLNRKHNYYYQIQGQLFVTKRKFCDFVVWTPKGINIETIEADEDFIEQMVPKLVTFYNEHYGPETVDSRHERSMPIRHSTS